jgi:hypothetical protein
MSIGNGGNRMYPTKLSSEAPILIEISVRSIKDHPFFLMVSPRPQQAVIVGRSAHKDYSFELETGALNIEQSRRCRMLKHHGSTVIEFSDEQRSFVWNPLRWQESMIIKAMDKIATLYPENEEIQNVHVYNPEFADKVLKVATNAFPNQVTMHELKYALSPEPSNESLFMAIDGLEADGYIEAKLTRGNDNRIADVAHLRATREGRKHLDSEAGPVAPSGGTVIHSQINTYAPVGAVGSYAHGVVNIHNEPTAIDLVDLSVLAVQLEQLRSACHQSARSRDDDKQIALIGDAAEAAEKGDRKGVALFLSKVSKTVMEKAQDIGTDILAKTIAELITHF